MALLTHVIVSSVLFTWSSACVSYGGEWPSIVNNSCPEFAKMDWQELYRDFGIRWVLSTLLYLLHGVLVKFC